MSMLLTYTAVPLCPLAGALASGLLGRQLGRRLSHCVAILGVFIAAVLSIGVFLDTIVQGHSFYGTVYHWITAGNLSLDIGFMIDPLTATMMVVVTSVSLMVHLYTIGYMAEDSGYQRFFSYISLFTFAMLMLVMSNNFLQLFFGWEGVGLVSYLLIGFWYTRPTAIYANLKAFLVNRVGDFGFALGIGLIYARFGSLDYKTVFAGLDALRGQTITLWGDTPLLLVTVISICLFIGAMGKSAQFPLHVWLPDSMEGPTPISALIHAATMVTAGIFMVSRMSPIFEMSDTALTFVMWIGGITAFFMGLMGLIQNDIKRVVAYSTLSQLGYMTVALGVSAYPIAVFHLVTHAFFKALLFLGAGSVIMAMHHEQDIRKMGGLSKKLPITWFTSLVGSLALIGFPLFSGFYSKDAILEAVGASNLPGHGIIHCAVLSGVFITAFYSFRMYFLVFHGKARWQDAHHDDHHHKDDHGSHGHGHDDHHHHEPHESPWVVTVPLVFLAIPSVILGFFLAPEVMHGSFFKDAIVINETLHPAMKHLTEDFDGSFNAALHGFISLPFFLAMLGVALSWFFYLKQPRWPQLIAKRFSFVYTVLENKYYMDRFNEVVWAGGARALGSALWRGGDIAIIDRIINGAASFIGVIARCVRRLQTGYLYHYAFVMLLGVAIALFFMFSFPLIG